MLRRELTLMRGGRRTFWIATTLLAIAAAEILFLFGAHRTLPYDSHRYYQLAQWIGEDGLAGAAYSTRTYGYPLFVAVCTGFSRVGPGTARALVFHVQLCLLLAIAAGGARLVGQLQRSDLFSRITYAATAASPFLLARATETLSDLLAGLLGYFAVLLVWKRDYPARPQSPPAAAAASLFLAACATIVRPAAGALLVAVAGLWIARQWLWRELRPAIVPLLLVVSLLPFLPQIVINKRAYDRTEPLVVDPLYRDQMRAGMSRLKYATSVRPGGPPQIDYTNPLYRGEKTPGELFRRRPLAYVATAAIHLFALLDQDFLFSAVAELHPMYRWPLSAVNFLFLFVGGVGAVLSLRPPEKYVRRDPRRFAAAALLVAAGAAIMVYLPTAVESRFAVPVELLWAPFFAAGCVALHGLWKENQWRLLAALSGGGLVFTLLCLRVSAWITAQAPALK